MKIERGEVIRINLNPTEGREPSGNTRPCLVISNTQYNAKRRGIVVVMPITGTLRPDVKMMMALPESAKLNGAVIAEQVRTVDLKTRWWKSTGEVLSKEWVDSAVDTFSLIVR